MKFRISPACRQGRDFGFRIGVAVRQSAIRNPQSAIGTRGIALLIVVSVLAVVGIMGVSFAFSMHLETQATRQFVSTTQARYLAESGVSYARAVLDEDRIGSRTDDLTESWMKDFAGSDVDLDGDDETDARWWLLDSSKGETIGRYAVSITDEGGKANLNSAQAEPSPLALGAIDLTTLLEQAEIANAAEAAQAIEQYRYGEDGRPGVAGVDDNADGSIDEPDEYQPLVLRGDDRRLEALEEVVGIAGLSADELQRLAGVATVYSWDTNVSVDGTLRLNVNTATSAELLALLLAVGVNDPWQAAVNIADAVDSDLEISTVTKASQHVVMTNQGSLGGWTWEDLPKGHYESATADETTLSWSAQVPTGTYRVLARGLPGVKVGDVAVAGQLKPSVDDGESLGAFELSGTVSVTVINRESPGTPCAFRGIELVSEVKGAEGVLVRGVEAVRFNEIMVEPSLSLEVSAATFDAQGSDWSCAEAVCANSGVGQGRWVWSSSLLQPGRYYIRVFGTAPGQTVGEVRVDTQHHLLVHGQVHPSTVLVGADGKITLTIGKTASEGTYYLKSLSVSLQPDAEYVELINLSDREIDVTGWTIDGELTGGRQAKFPSGSVIKPHGLLLAAVDLDDAQESLEQNGISARGAWEIPEDTPAVQLEFSGGSPSPSDDWLKASVSAGITPRLRLRNGASIVDEGQYPLPAPAQFQSVEKGDPTVILDDNQDGIDEGWFPSLRLYTAGLPNDNVGLKEQRGLQVITHDPAEEVVILNRPLEGVGQLAGVPSGTAWRPIVSTDLAKMVDRLTVEGYRLELEGHGVAGAGQEAWEEKSNGYYVHTDPAKADVSGRWQWIDIPEGSYRFSLYSCRGCSGEQISIRWERADRNFTDWSPPLLTDIQGRIIIGRITVGMGETPPNTLTLEARCASPSGICHVDNVQLDPQLIRLGAVNINTARSEVLLSLPGVTAAIAERIIAQRPYGDRQQKGRGIGDVLIGDMLSSGEAEKLELFQELAHLLTVRSDVFQIVSVGEAVDKERAQAIQRIVTVVQR